MDRVRARIALTVWDLGLYGRRPRRIAVGELLDADDPVVVAAPEHFVAVGA